MTTISDAGGSFFLGVPSKAFAVDGDKVVFGAYLPNNSVLNAYEDDKVKGAYR